MEYIEEQILDLKRPLDAQYPSDIFWLRNKIYRVVTILKGYLQNIAQ